MTTYAVIQTGGKQYRVRPGEVLRVERLVAQQGQTVEFQDVRLVATEGDLQVGQPVVKGSRVVAEVEGHGRGEKVTVLKFKAKVRYRVKQGHRQAYTQVRIKEIVRGDPKDGA